MKSTRRSLKIPIRAALSVAVAAATLGAAPLLAQPAAADTGPSVSAGCADARAALVQARRSHRAAKARVAKARKQVRRAKRADRPVKVRKARAAVKRAVKRSQRTARIQRVRASGVGYACSAPASAARARAAGKSLALLSLADGLDLGPISPEQLLALLDRVLPGVAENLTQGQLDALLNGFNLVANGAGGLNDLRALLGDQFSLFDVTSLLGGTAGAGVISDLAGELLGQLSIMGGGLPVPGSFDPAALWETAAGIFGQLSSEQLGSLLALLTTATGGGGSTFDLGQLTGLLDSLVPGLTGSLGSGDLTDMLGGLNGGLSAETLANLLGGAFSLEELTSVLDGLADDELVGTVLSQVLAQLATGGQGGLELPGALDLGTLTDLVSTVTGLIDALLGEELLPVICSVVPLPGLCG